MKLEKLKYYIGQRLENLVQDGFVVFNGKASLKQSCPYLTYKFPSNTPIETMKKWILEIDFWDDTNNDLSILEASENVKNGKYNDEGELLYQGLDFSFQNETEGFYKCYLDFEGEIEDTEKNISRINQRYILDVY